MCILDALTSLLDTYVFERIIWGDEVTITRGVKISYGWMAVITEVFPDGTAPNRHGAPDATHRGGPASE